MTDKLSATRTPQWMNGNTDNSSATRSDRCPFKLRISPSATPTLPCRLAAAPSTPCNIADNRSNSLTPIPPLSCSSSRASTAPSVVSRSSCSTYPQSNASDLARRLACCRVPNMPKTDRRSSRSSQDSLLTSARNSTCRARRTLTVVETSVARAMEITGTTTPVIVGRKRFVANICPSTARPIAPYWSRIVATNRLMSSHDRKATRDGMTASIMKN